MKDFREQQKFEVIKGKEEQGRAVSAKALSFIVQNITNYIFTKVLQYFPCKALRITVIIEGEYAPIIEKE